MQLEYDPANWAAKEYYYKTNYTPKSLPVGSSQASSLDSYVPSLTVSASDSYAALPAYSRLDDLETHVDAITQGFTAPLQNDPISAFSAGKQAFLGKSVEDIVGMIYERETLRDE